jgi:preprotein translocase subunit SecD
MSKSNNIVLLIIILLFGLCVWAIVPNSQLSSAMGRDGMRLGLDLKGGVQLVYQVQFTDNMTDAEKNSAMDATILKIQQRINTFGVTEPIIQKINNDRIQIQLPGFTDIEAAKSLVEQTGFLEFREVERDASGKLITLGDYIKQSSYQFINGNETGSRLFVNTNSSTGSFGTLVAVLSKDATGITLTDANGNPADNATLSNSASLYSWVPSRGDDGTPLTGSLLSDAQANIEQLNTFVINIKWNSEGAKIFDQIAARIHNPAGQGGTYAFQYVLGIFLDDKLISAPQMTSTNYQGQGTISGSFTQKSSVELATLLKSGSLPMPLEKPPLYQQTVSATLGIDSLNRSLVAGIIGIAMVAIFMIAYYNYLGVVATLALLVYGAISMTIFKIWPVTLTLPGIAGFIISVGMAVDANVLIFERMKEEIRLGRTLEAGVAEGFRRAWPSIRDSNVSTFITCIILYWFGSVFGAFMVKGFAITLFLGVAVSMFSAIIVTRTFLRSLIHIGIAKKYLHGSVK